MKRLKLGLIVAMSSLTLEAHSANWVYVVPSIDGNISWYVDTTSFRYNNNRPKDVWFWVQQQYSPKSEIFQKFKAATSKIQFHVSCPSRTYIGLDTIYYDAKGNVQQSVASRGDYDFNMQSIAPDTLIDVVATYACTQAFGV